MKTKILKLGWEFPPNNWGGLGVACYGLTKGLLNNGAQVKLILPNKQKSSLKNLDLIHARTDFSEDSDNQKSVYQNLYTSLFKRVYAYAKSCEAIAIKEDYDVIHAHDWMTFKAAIKIKKISDKPLFVHVHSTEVDRQGTKNIKKRIYEIEKKGMQAADKVFAVSNFEKQRIIKYYNIDESKIEVIHNALSDVKKDFELKSDKKDSCNFFAKKLQSKKFKVLFLGRLTYQKGPEYFIKAADKILKKQKNIEFIIAGDGDMRNRLEKLVKKLKIKDFVFFTGFLRGKQIDQIYKLADVYVMPSVCEPFGLAPLEAMENGTPAIVSKDAGVCEIINNCIKVDFKNVLGIAKEIIRLSESKDLQKKLSVEGKKEACALKWNDAAKKCLGFYKQIFLQNYSFKKRVIRRLNV